MDRELQRRIAANEAVFRELNEGIARGQWPGEEQERVGFRCECARLGCNSVIELTLPAYHAIREHPRRFVIAVGHELADAERVVQNEGDYAVVEKCDEAGEFAESSDPRE